MTCTLQGAMNNKFTLRQTWNSVKRFEKFRMSFVADRILSVAFSLSSLIIHKVSLKSLREGLEHVILLS